MTDRLVRLFARPVPGARRSGFPRVSDASRRGRRRRGSPPRDRPNACPRGDARRCRAAASPTAVSTSSACATLLADEAQAALEELPGHRAVDGVVRPHARVRRPRRVPERRPRRHQGARRRWRRAPVDHRRWRSDGGRGAATRRCTCGHHYQVESIGNRESGIGSRQQRIGNSTARATLSRRADVASTPSARRAGMYVAASATMATSTRRSGEESRVRRAHVEQQTAQHARERERPANPIATPSSVTRIPSPSTSESTSRGCAPSAMRTPISRRR